MTSNYIKLGVDIGSTTAKVVALDENANVLYKSYRRHYTRLIETITEILHELKETVGDVEMTICLTGSGAMGLTERMGLQFVQEVIAVTKSLKTFYPDAKTLIDIGGEDAKLVLLVEGKAPDIRMNGNCAGGTGSFIDQMATLLNIPIENLDGLAQKSTKIYPIASRCGVFAKTDVQNLIARKIDASDIAASIFHAVALQTVNSLARGCDMLPKVVFCGGPMTYITSLQKAFVNLLKLGTEDYAIPKNAQLFTALGAALSAKKENTLTQISQFIEQLSNYAANLKPNNAHLEPLFSDKKPLAAWEKERHIVPIPKTKASRLQQAFLGIDSGSTTTKIVITDPEANLLYSFYANNEGNPLNTVIKGLLDFQKELEANNSQLQISGAAVTGYGEDLIHSALNLDHGIVETIAHYLAAKKIDPKVSFVLDIGGQDIKAIFAQNDTITDIEINEACSSGCGSFIEGFARNLGYSAQAFSELACKSTAPCDLGSRCTVFMNSKVRQSIKDGATVEDLSAGLAYSVVKNCLFKVLNLEHVKEIGDNIVVQGGTFKNQAVFRALEMLSGKTVSCSDKPELMGAYGAALYAISKQNEKPSTFIGFENLTITESYTTKFTHCKACTNNCQITIFDFPNGKKCYSGNKCEKVFTNNSEQQERGASIFDFKREILFKQDPKKATAFLKIGIPRILTIYENFPFWQSLFTQAGVKVILSNESTVSLYEKGSGTIMSDNICFPAKLSHGHIIDLAEQGANRIFYPFILFEKEEFSEAHNCYNCPIVTAYSEVLHNIKTGIPIDSPAISFKDTKLLKKACVKYLASLGVDKKLADKAFAIAYQQQEQYKEAIRQKNEAIVAQAKEKKQPIIMLAGHPYHADPLIHQKISDILSDLGVAVINEEIAIEKDNNSFRTEYFTISQWAYPNRILHAAAWVSQQTVPVYFVQMNSFGCGPDAIIVDEVKDILKRNNKSFTLIRIDEIASTGSIKLRLRSLVESIKLKQHTETQKKAFITTKPYGTEDRKKTILAPWFGDFYSPFVPAIFELMGYKIVNLPKSSKQSLDVGLKAMNNEICYPALLVVGDILSALQSGNYDLNDIVVGITQTGGQCRATNYIAMIKRSLINAGYKDIPVLAITTGAGTINDQPGFEFDFKKVFFTVLHSIFFGDALSRLYYSTVSRELVSGQSEALRDKYLQLSTELLRLKKHKQLKELLKEAINEYNAIACTTKEVQVIGIIGEIYVKYNSFGNYGIINWLLEQGVEVAIPPITNFFMQTFINNEVKEAQFVAPKGGWNGLSKLSEIVINKYIAQYEKMLTKFVRYRPVENVREEAELASKTVNLLNQYGEGWLIPGEIAGYAKQGIKDIVCIQPFGCIANHVVGKGIEKKIKKDYPDINLLFLDFDYGTSEVNVHNRLHFMLLGKEEKSVSE